MKWTSNKAGRFTRERYIHVAAWFWENLDKGQFHFKHIRIKWDLPVLQRNQTNLGCGPWCGPAISIWCVWKIPERTLRCCTAICAWCGHADLTNSAFGHEKGALKAESCLAYCPRCQGKIHCNSFVKLRLGRFCWVYFLLEMPQKYQVWLRLHSQNQTCLHFMN